MCIRISMYIHVRRFACTCICMYVCMYVLLSHTPQVSAVPKFVAEGKRKHFRTGLVHAKVALRGGCLAVS